MQRVLVKNPMTNQAEMSNAIIDVLSKYSKNNSPNFQKKRIREKLQQEMDKGNRLLLVSSDVYTALPTAVVTIDKLYDNFAQGHVHNKLNNIDIPYDINYYSLIANRNALKLYRTYSEESQVEGEDV